MNNPNGRARFADRFGTMAARDLIEIAVAALLFYLLATLFDIHHSVSGWAASYHVGGGPIDHLILTILFLPLALVIFAFRRWRELGAEITRRELTEKELRAAVTRAEEEKAKTQSVFSAIGVGISIQDREFRVLYQNPMHKAIIGDHAGQFCYRVYEKREDVCDGCPVAMSFRDGGVHTTERSVTGEEGTRHFEITASPLLDSSGNIVAGIEAAREITAQKEAGEQLIRTNATLEALIRVSPLAIVVFDRDGTIHLWNPAAERMFGWTEKEAVGRFHPIVPKDKMEEFSRIRATALQGESFTNLELKRLRKDGSAIDISVSTAPLRESDGRITRVMSIITDITERKRIDEELNIQARVLESMAEGVSLTDENGTILFTNRAYDAMFGRERGEFLGEHVTVLNAATPMESERIFRTVTEELRRGGAWSGEFANRRKDGTTFFTHANISLLEIGGKTFGVTVQEDITRNKQAEEALRHSEDQLRQKQKMEAVGRLAGGVAHDFNNLLTAINGYCELLLRRMGPEHQMRHEVEEILKGGERAASLTRQLLAFSRRQVFQLKVIDLNAIVSNMERMLRRLIGEDIALMTDLERELAPVKADPGQIEQVLMNLAVNARDAMPAGGILTLKTANVDMGTSPVAHGEVMVKPGQYVLLAVSDTGCGMDEATKTHLFEPFFTTKEKGKGTGLGMATVYGIVKQSDGYIWVYSEVGKGTTIKIYLPRVEEAVDPLPGKTAAVRTEPGMETVLVVEDEELVRDLACEILSMNGYYVLSAPDGPSAIRLIERNEGHVHLLLTDVVMPGMGGPELADRLSQERPGIRVLYMSGYTENAIIVHGILAPGTSFIEKPFRPDALARKVREVLDGSVPSR